MCFEDVKLQEEISWVIKVLEFKSKDRNIELLSEIDPEVPKIFCTEPRRLKQILINLVGNSIKFTFEGHVKINVSTIHINDELMVKIEVKDTGIGIKQESFGKIFNMFDMLEDKA